MRAGVGGSFGGGRGGMLDGWSGRARWAGGVWRGLGAGVCVAVATPTHILTRIEKDGEHNMDNTLKSTVYGK